MESDRTVALKELLGVSGKDQVGNYSFFVMPGIRLKIAKFIRSLRSLLPSTNSSSQSTIKTSTISSDLLQQYPFLNDLIYCLESNLLNDLTLDIISNMISNLVHSKNLFRYKQSVKDFAACLYILGGRTVVEFIRLNIPGFIPSLPSLRPMLQSSKYHFIEGVFQYDHLADFIKPFNCKYAFCGEDSTSVVPKVSYDTLSDYFVGFTLPLKHGFPCPRYFSTNSFGELENWYNEVDVSFNINVHIIQGLFSIGQTSPPPFLLGAYGTNSKYTALDVLKRWINIFDLCMAQNLRILGFSTDCDTRYMKAMRDSMGFFSKFETGFENHPDHFEISMLQNTSWFFLKPHQLFVCLQDGVHLCTKLRNRLLAANVVLLMGEQYASVSYLIELIENCSKIDHGLVISDVYPKDKQNFASCVKISSNGVLNVLKKIQNSEATQVYLQEVNKLAFKKLARSTCESSKKKNTESKNENEAAVARIEDEDEDKDKEEQEEVENDDDERRSSKNHAVDESDDSISINEFDLDILPDVSSSTIHGMRIFDSINQCQSTSFFPVDINGVKKFMHKQTANWYFAKTKPIVSSDRLKRVQNKH
ncbi:unnamed protein product [Rotaria magnacalcarata]|uniref:Uncharacterized protein n=2 Tax=Rotaria magnacalcarata TaxID=392030 RepID=A0A816UEK0_9BILA|nr:unnamed protein product [Rotaria magnacalcarata]